MYETHDAHAGAPGGCGSCGGNDHTRARALSNGQKAALAAVAVAGIGVAFLGGE